MTGYINLSSGLTPSFISSLPQEKAKSPALSNAQSIVARASSHFPDFLKKNISSSLIGRCLPSYTDSQSEAFISECLDPLRETILSSERSSEEVVLKTADGAAISAMHFTGTACKAILFLHGNGGFYETCYKSALEIRTLSGVDAHVLVFNPRGTGRSSGTPSGHNLALDVLAAFQYLVEQEIDPSDIVIYGHSMGGCIGAIGAQLIQEVYPESPIHLVSDRSFSTMHDRLRVFTERELMEDGKWSKISPLYLRTLSIAARLGDWDMDAVEATKALKGRVCIIYHPTDTLIIPSISLYEAANKAGLLSKGNFSFLQMNQEDANPHRRSLVESEKIFVQNALFQMWSLR